MKIENAKVGMSVKYSQGRGSGLIATVKAIDTESGVLSLEDEKGRKFTRDASKVQAK